MLHTSNTYKKLYYYTAAPPWKQTRWTKICSTNRKDTTYPYYVLFLILDNSILYFGYIINWYSYELKDGQHNTADAGPRRIIIILSRKNDNDMSIIIFIADIPLSIMIIWLAAKEHTKVCKSAMKPLGGIESIPWKWIK